MATETAPTAVVENVVEAAEVAEDVVQGSPVVGLVAGAIVGVAITGGVYLIVRKIRNRRKAAEVVEDCNKSSASE